LAPTGNVKEAAQADARHVAILDVSRSACAKHGACF